MYGQVRPNPKIPGFDTKSDMIAYYYDGIANDGSLRTDVNTLRGGNATSNSTGIMVSEWFNRGYIDPPVEDRINATMPYMTSAAGEVIYARVALILPSVRVAGAAEYQSSDCTLKSQTL